MFQSRIFRIIAAGICGIVILSGVAQTTPVRAGEEVWKLDKTIITPSGGTLKTDDGYHSWTASSTRLTHTYTFPYPALDNWQNFDFAAPPEELVPGKTITLKVTGTGGGSDPIISYEEFQFRALLTTSEFTDIADFVWESELLARLGMGGTHGVGPEVKTVDFQVPAISDDTLYITATLFSSGSIPGWGCTIRWIYKRGDADEKDEATWFTGYALAYDDNNGVIPIKDATVRLRLERDGDVTVINAITGSDGMYAIAAEGVTDKTTYQVQLMLTEKSEVFLVTWHDELKPATYLTPAREAGPDSLGNLVIANFLFEPSMPQGEPFWVVDNGDLVALTTQRTVTQDRSAALVYARTYKAMDYGRNRLGVTYNLHLPISVTIGGTSTNTSCYIPAYEQIVIHANDFSKVLVAEADQPEWHEFCHFFTHDSPWLGDNADFPVPDVENHAGVRNASSGDSVVEGAAEFLVALVKGVAARTDDDVPYDLSGTPVNLQDNIYQDYDRANNRWIPWEEWQFAALLWDIMDQDINPEAGDTVAWGLSKLWDVLVTVTDPTIHGHYVALKAAAGEPLPGPQTPPTPLDDLFILHGFYANTDNVTGWVQGEPIGYPDSWETRANPTSSWGPTQDPAGVRFIPAIPDYLWFEPVLPPGIPSSSKAEMTVYPSAGGVPWSVTITADENGRFPITVPASADRVQIQLTSPGYQISPVSFTRDAYRTAVEDNNTLVKIEPLILPSQVSPPTGFSIQRSGSSPVGLSWSVSPGAASVIIVRGSTRIPTGPGDGTVIYEGTGTSVYDTEPIPAGSSYYAAFAVGIDGGISTPAVATSVADTVQPDSLTATTGGAVQPGSSTTVPPSDSTTDGGLITQLPRRPDQVPVSQVIKPKSNDGTWYFVGAGIAFVWMVILLVRRKKKTQEGNSE